MKNKKNLGALIGLAGAVNNNQKTDHTDEIVIQALLSEDSEEMLKRIRREKFTISPNCETCQMPCGNTSDYDMDMLEQQPKEIRDVKQEIVQVLVELAEVCKEKKRLPACCNKAFSYLSYELTLESYQDLLEELRNAKTDYQN